MSAHDHENVQDVRHMLNEALDVARRRRWTFLIPAAVGTLVAMVYTFTYPRVYNARTIFERRDTLIQANLIRAYQHNPYAFSRLRRSIYIDVKGYKAVEVAIEQLGMDKDLPRDADGELTEKGKRIKQAMVNKFSSKCEVYLQDETDSCDNITVLLPSEKPEVVAALVTKLRDNYIKNARRRIYAILSDAYDYFQEEAKKCRTEVTRLEAKTMAFRAEFPGIDPSDPESVVRRIMAMKAQKGDLEKRIRELKAEIQVNQEARGVAGTTTPSSDQIGSTSLPSVLNVRVAMPAKRVNPVYAEGEAAVIKLKKEIEDRRSTLTDEHPAMRRLYERSTRLEQELAQTPKTIAAAHGPVVQRGVGGRAGLMDEADRIRRQEQIKIEVSLRELNQQLVRAEREARDTHERTALLENQKVAVLERREEFLCLKNDLAAARESLAKESKRLVSISELLKAEKNNSGVTFEVLEETQVSPKPVSPKVGRLVTMSIGFGIAVGLGLVLLTELLDRTFRSASQVTEALGLPVLQSIGQIITPEYRRRRFARQVMMHATATAVIALAGVTGGMVYLSLEKPQLFERIKDDPGLVTRQILGIG